MRDVLFRTRQQLCFEWAFRQLYFPVSRNDSSLHFIEITRAPPNQSVHTENFLRYQLIHESTPQIPHKEIFRGTAFVSAHIFKILDYNLQTNENPKSNSRDLPCMELGEHMRMLKGFVDLEAGNAMSRNFFEITFYCASKHHFKMRAYNSIYYCRHRRSQISIMKNLIKLIVRQ